MKLNFVIVLSIFILLLLISTPQTVGDINSDREALLDFAANVPHLRTLNWNSSKPICSSWVGITCSQDSSHVIALRLPGVGLYGPIPPSTLAKLDSLEILSLRSNLLSGTPPSDLMSLPSLRYIYLQNNNFSGNIPSSLSPLLIWLDLSFNSISGEIPNTIQNLTHLKGLSLQNNTLRGFIPEFILPRLRHLNLSYNQFSGSIPSSLQTFPSSSFVGNHQLCGPPLNQCSTISPSPSPSATNFSKPPKEGSKRKLNTGAVVAIAVGASAFLILLILMMVCCCMRKKYGKGNAAAKGKGGRNDKPKEDFGSGVQDAEKNKLVFFEGCTYGFDLEDLLRASAEVLGKGSFGTTYKAILEEGTTVVVKRLREVVGKKEFEQQMEIVGALGQHPNIVPVRAYYYSKDEKLLVYDFIAGGSFSALLHGMNNS